MAPTSVCVCVCVCIGSCLVRCVVQSTLVFPGAQLGMDVTCPSSVYLARASWGLETVALTAIQTLLSSIHGTSCSEVASGKSFESKLSSK